MKQHSITREVIEKIREHDHFSNWLGMELLEIREGYCRVQMTIREEMINGIGIVHGGIPFSLADSAFGYACNNRNDRSVALDTSISFIKPIHLGDAITAEANEIHNGRSTGVYLVTIHNQKQEQVALFKGTCFRTGKPLIGNETSL
jgi:acyl-CoA thioesterase